MGVPPAGLGVPAEPSDREEGSGQTPEPAGGTPVLPLAVLNPGGNDRMRLFPDGAGSPAEPGHAPVNYHAYAACGRGGFYQAATKIPSDVRAVLVLLRKTGLSAALPAVKALQRRGLRVFISWKESGLHQVADCLASSRHHENFRALCQEADGFLSSTPELVPLYQSAGCRTGGFVPTPYPVEEPPWDFSVPVAQRRGILVGTREFDIPTRNHYFAVALACRLGGPVTAISTDGAGDRLLRSISREISIVRGPLPYAEYLRVMARHRLVFQLDRSAVPGQVAGDALLCRIPCVGGDGAVERLAFENLNGLGRDPAELAALAGSLLADDEAYAAEIEKSRAAALEKLSFSAVAAELQKFHN